MPRIDVIFCTNQRVTSKHGVDVSIFDASHHIIIYGKINIFAPLLPIFIYEVLNYSRTDVNNIKKISNSNFENFSENFLWMKKLNFYMNLY